MTEEIKKDRHRPGYWKERWQKQKQQGKQKDRHRPGYYREYNLRHSERLARVGIYVSKKFSKKITEDGLEILGYDKMGRPVTADKLADLLRNKEGLLLADEDDNEVLESKFFSEMD